MNLRPFQRQALQALSSHDHVILVSATGTGKSLIFQEYLRQHPSVRALLISPLSALGRQHAQKFKGESAIPANIKIMSPERALQDQKLKLWKLGFLIVDEAHCVWEWGADFRPDFKFVLTLVKEWKIRKSFWCTATLPPQARTELKRYLPPKRTIELGTFSVPSMLTISVQKVVFSDRIEAIYRFCSERPSRLGIVFANTRMLTERLVKYFKQWGIPVFQYHAGMSTEERLNLERCLKSQVHGVIVATSAFGMGMNIPQISYSVLFQPPFTLLSLMQAFGRATRTEQQVEGVLFWSEDDFLRYEWMIQGRTERRNELTKVKAWCQTAGNKRVFLENYFNSTIE